MWILYQLALTLALVAAAPYLLIRRGRHYLETLPGRLGRSSTGTERHDLWLHAVSVGEVAVAATLAEALPEQLSLLVTTVTPTGQARARSSFDGRATVGYLPFDLAPPIRRFLRSTDPRSLILVEGEYWPLLLRFCERRDMPVYVVNGRISDRNLRRLERIKGLLRPLFGSVTRFGMQSEQDRRRLISLGVDARRIEVTGNLKYDSPLPPRLEQLEQAILQLGDGRPILVAGSTMPGEEELVLEAFERVGGGDAALLVLAPRHPERFDAVHELVAERDLSTLRRSRFDLHHPPAGAAPALVLLDTLGELAALYRIATGSFIGGTLVPTGGHNPIEAARFGIPVAAGPSMENFHEVAQHFDDADAWRRVAGAAELGDAFGEWIAAPDRARELSLRASQLVEHHRGARDRTLEMLRPLLQEGPPP